MFLKSRIWDKPEWIAAFLGNPGDKYKNTRHNAGFIAGDIFAASKSAPIRRLKFHALTSSCRVGGESVLLMKPQTFMNLSGDAVSAAASYYKIPASHIVVVCDDMALPVAKLRIKRGGSAGGHNGLKDIIAKLGTDAFPRVKIGVGFPPHPDFDVVDWVIGKVPAADLKAIEECARRAGEAVECLIEDGIETAMNRFN